MLTPSHPLPLPHSGTKDFNINMCVMPPTVLSGAVFVLSVYHVKTWAEAIEIENSNPFGNAACIYTSNGGSAEWFTSRFRAAMLGINNL